MIDLNFYNYLGPIKIKDILENISGDLVNSNYLDIENTCVHNVATLEKATKNDIAVLHNKKYHKDLISTNALCCIIPKNMNTEGIIAKNMIIIDHLEPYYAYSQLINMFYSEKSFNSGIHSSAIISDSATIGVNTKILENVVIEENVEIGENSIIEQNTVIKRGVKIGKNARIYSNVVIKYSVIGDNATILEGAKIGQDGFGISTFNGFHNKVFHFGKVIIGNDVEIGANTTIDRGSIEDTVIEDNCKIDNLVQIAHNVKIGKGSIIVAQVGIAGSTKIGKYCALGGQSGVSGHLKIADKVRVAAASAVLQDIDTPNQTVAGIPAISSIRWHRKNVITNRLIDER